MVRPVPGYPNQRTSPDRPKWSGSCQKPPRLFRLRDFMRKKSVRWSATPSRTSSKVSMRASRQRSARAPNRLLYSSGGTCLPELVRLACFIQETELSELAIADLDQYFRFVTESTSGFPCNLQADHTFHRCSLSPIAFALRFPMSYAHTSRSYIHCICPFL